MNFMRSCLAMVLTICLLSNLSEAKIRTRRAKETKALQSKEPKATKEPKCSTAVKKPPLATNSCDAKKVDIPNFDCVTGAIANVKPQAGGEVTVGYVGGMHVDHPPIVTPFWQNGMCPVNVHWHLGTEHYSDGEYDEHGVGPPTDHSSDDDHLIDDFLTVIDDDTPIPFRALSGETRPGYQCHHYDANDAKFTQEYDWKHCLEMTVGETYEIHWPHSAAGACGTPDQYQTPFYDGVFCRDGILSTLHDQIGVQAQVFTVVNDESYYYPDLFRGMIVDGEMGQSVTKYTGSTTGTSRDNFICSAYSPITWQVDRKCHLISASSFDKMCADMKSQRDDMSDDLHPHGSRELVLYELTADNQVNRRKNRDLRA